MNMPVMDGLECLTEMVQNPRLNSIPVVILSGSTASIDSSRIQGAKAFIKKPCDIKTLSTNIEQMINLDFVADSHLADRTFQLHCDHFDLSLAY